VEVVSKPYIVIEHCEDELSPWLILEYRHASKIYGRDRLVFTRVPRRHHRLLSKYGEVREESVVELVSSGSISPSAVIVLDPRATETLDYKHLLEAKYVVVGGILGDHPPRGRTWLYITSRMPSGVRAFNIGERQYSIDGAVYYVDYLWRNKGLEGYRYVDGVVVESEHGEIYLPFRYPVVNNKPLLAEGLEYYLKYRRLRDDIWREIVDP
jgi:ribosome biogenesis SPOUT family RNA methylase Rps3